MRRAVESALGPVLQDIARAATQMSRTLGQVDTTQLTHGLQGASDSARELARNAATAAQATEDVGDAADDAGSKGKKFDGMGAQIKDLGVKAAGAAAGLLAVGTAADAIGNALERLDLSSALKASLGLTADEAAKAGKVAAELFKGGFVADFGEANEVVKTVIGNFRGLNDADLSKVTAAANDFSHVMGVDVGEAAVTAGTLVKTHLAKDGVEAFDLLTAASQKLGPQIAEEIPGLVNAYAQGFSSIGFDGQQAFALLIKAAEGGQEVMDHTGDAVKEFGVKISESDELSAQAFSALGFNAESMFAAFRKGGPEAETEFNKVIQGLLGITDSGKQAAEAQKLFGSPIGEIGQDKLPAFLASLTASNTAMDDFAGSTKTAGEDINSGLNFQIQKLKNEIQDGLVTALTKSIDFIQNSAIPALKDFGQVFLDTDFATSIKDAFSADDNLFAGLFDAFKTGLGKLPGIVVDFIGEIPGRVEDFVRTIDWGNVAESLFNGIKEFLMSGGPIIVAAIAALPLIIAGALAAALVAAGIGVAKALGDMFSDNVWPFLQEVPGKVVEFLGDLAGPVIDWFSEQWSSFTSTITGVVDTTGDFITGLPGKIVGWLGDLTGAVGGWFSEQWSNFTAGLGVTIDLASTFFSELPGKILGWIGDLAGSLGVWFSEQWSNFTTGLGAILDTISAPFEKVGGFIQSALSNVTGFFSNAVDGIRSVWDGLKEVVAAPIRFFVDTVYTGGIAKAWNAVQKFLPIPPAPEIHFGAADGAVLPGWTPGRDVHRFYSPTAGMLDLSGGEAVMRPEFTQALGAGRINELNRLARHGGTNAVRGALGLADGGVIGFSEGGIIDSIVGLIHKYFPGMEIGSTWRNEPGSFHNVGMAVDTSNNTNFALMDKVATFFYQNFGGQLAELIHWPLNGWQNIDEGKPFDFGEKTNNEHRDHVHIANRTPLPDPGTGELISGFAGLDTQGALTGTRSGGVLASVRAFVADRARDVLDTILGPIRDLIPTGNSVFEKIPLAIFDKLKDGLYGFIGGEAGKVDKSITGGAIVGGSGVERFRPLVEQLLTVYGQATSLAQNTLRRMMQESAGKVDAVNDWDSNWLAGTPSVGLMQVIGPTYSAFKDPQFDAGPYLYGVSVDPAANISSSMRYALHQYGGLAAAYDRAGGYDEGGIANGKGVMLKNTIAPERVLSPEQTRMFEALVAALQSLSTSGSSAITTIFDSIGSSVSGVVRDLVNAAVVPVEKKKDEDPAPVDTTFLGKTQQTLDKQDDLLSNTQELAIRSQSSESMARQKELDLLKEQLTDVANKLTAGVLGPVVESAFDNALDVVQKWLGAGFTEVVDGTDRTTQAVQNSDNADTQKTSTPAFGLPGSAFDAASVISSAVVSVANTASSAILAVGQDIAKAALAQTTSKVSQSAGVLGKDISGGFLIDTLVRLTGVEIQIRDTLTASAEDVRKFRGEDFRGFDETGQLLSDTASLIERSETSQELAIAEQNRINQALIKALLKYLMISVVLPILTAVLTAMITVATTAIGAAIGSFIPVIGTAIGAAVGALVGVALSGVAAAFIATAGLGVGAALDSFDEGGIASGVGFMPKNTIRPERVLSPRQTDAFETFAAALANGELSVHKSVVVGNINVHGQDAPKQASNRLLSLLNS